MSEIEERYDAVIVGSGVAGALVAKDLANNGYRVLILEAGTELNDAVGSTGLLNDIVSPRVSPVENAQNLMLKPHSLHHDAKSWSDAASNYLDQRGPKPFMTTFERKLGGTANVWLGMALRFIPSDFRLQTIYGVMTDWPLSYDDLIGWYGHAERELGVAADVEDQRYLGIHFPDGYKYPMPKVPHAKIDRVIGSRLSGFSFEDIDLKVRSTPAARNTTFYDGRGACQGSGSCVPFCPTGARYDTSRTLAGALATNNVEIKCSTVATDIEIDGLTGDIKSIKYKQYDNSSTHLIKSGSISATVFVIAANAIETAKLLLMSKNNGRTSHGVANSSGTVGRNLMDHPLYLAWGLSEEAVSSRGPMTTGGIEELRDGKFRSERAAYRIELGNDAWNYPLKDPRAAEIDFKLGTNETGLNPLCEVLAGRSLNEKVAEVQGRQFHISVLVEQTPDSSNRVLLSEHRDAMGLPKPLIKYNLSEYTVKGLKSAKQVADRIFDHAGATQYTSTPSGAEPNVVSTEIDGAEALIMYRGGSHIAGTACMGSDPKKSVLDSNQRSWDHQNLFLVGSSSFPTIGTANPTLTIAALALRTAYFIRKEILGSGRNG